MVECKTIIRQPAACMIIGVSGVNKLTLYNSTFSLGRFKVTSLNTSDCFIREYRSFNCFLIHMINNFDLGQAYKHVRVKPRQKVIQMTPIIRMT